MIRVKIVLQDGLVQEVFSDTENVQIEVLDMDTNDAEREKENEKEYNSIGKEYPYIVWH